MTSNAWMIIFGVPIVFQVLQILGLLLVVRHDFDNLETYFRERHNNPYAYRAIVNKLYRTEDNAKGNNQDAIDAFMEQNFEGRAGEKSDDANE